MTEFILVLAILSTESSYKSEVERPASRVPDTAQFWVAVPTTWRVRTYAIDHDIHVYSIARGRESSPMNQAEAEEHLRKHYSDVLSRLHVLKFKDPSDATEVSSVLVQHQLPGSLEVAAAGFAFYNPDRGTYKTQSQPR